MIAFEPLADVPRLSWLARARPRQPVLVRHGLGVETRPDGFVEGAWDGDFDAWDFDRAETLAGSGGRCRERSLVFAAPFHPLERLFVLKVDGEVHVSNSLVFLLTEAGDGLDLSHPNYYFDFVRQVRRGIAPPAAWLRTAAGRRVELYPCCNLELGPDLSLIRVAKPLGPPPVTYADYFGHLLDTTNRLAANASSSSRGSRFRMVAACSRGYDSTAAAALASRAGCREGVTFVQSNMKTGHPLFGVSERTEDDSGADSLRALGMSVAEFDRADFNRLPGHPSTEFFISSPVAITDAMTRLMEDTVRGSVFVSGRHGELTWGPTRRCRRRNLREVSDCLLSGQALGEFRLRTGFVHYPAPYVGALHGPAIYRITHSPEMHPWRLGTGYYDRPIARRMAEEAGVPRAHFGMRKLGAGVADRRFNAESEQDFRDFVSTMVPAGIRQALDERPFDDRIGRHRQLAYLRTHYAHWPLVGTAMDLLGTDRMHVMWNAVYLYRFHWGFEKVTHRYRGSCPSPRT